MLILIFYVMINLNMRMTFISIATMPIIFIFAFVFFSKVKKAFQDSDEAEAKLSTILQENLTGIRVVKAFARQRYEVEKFDK